MSDVTCHMSHVTCHVSHVFFLSFLFNEVLKLVGGGSVINGAYPIKFLTTKHLSIFLLHNGPAFYLFMKLAKLDGIAPLTTKPLPNNSTILQSLSNPIAHPFIIRTNNKFQWAKALAVKPILFFR